MNINEVIKYPLLTEKTYRQMAEGVYTFAVDPRTNRAEVKKAVETIFDVKVARVNIIYIDKKPTKLGKSEGFTNRMKKAIVKLADGQINIFPDEAIEATPVKEEKAAKVVEKKEMSEAEKKAAEKIAAKAKEKEEAAKAADKAEVKPVKEEAKAETAESTKEETK